MATQMVATVLRLQKRQSTRGLAYFLGRTDAFHAVLRKLAAPEMACDEDISRSSCANGACPRRSGASSRRSSDSLRPFAGKKWIPTSRLEAHRATRFTIQDCDDAAAPRKGARPGDGLANFVFCERPGGP